MSVTCDLWLHFRLILFLLRPDGGMRLRITFLTIESMCVWSMGTCCFYNSHSLLYSLHLFLNTNLSAFHSYSNESVLNLPLFMISRTHNFTFASHTNYYKWNTFDVIQPALKSSSRLQINIMYQHIIRSNRTRDNTMPFTFHCWTVRSFFYMITQNKMYNVKCIQHSDIYTLSKKAESSMLKKILHFIHLFTFDIVGILEYLIHSPNTQT